MQWDQSLFLLHFHDCYYDSKKLHRKNYSLLKGDCEQLLFHFMVLKFDAAQQKCTTVCLLFMGTYLTNIMMKNSWNEV